MHENQNFDSIRFLVKITISIIPSVEVYSEFVFKNKKRRYLNVIGLLLKI